MSSITGRFDILTFARFSSTDELSHFLQKELPKLEANMSSETFICLRVHKGYYVPPSIKHRTRKLRRAIRTSVS